MTALDGITRKLESPTLGALIGYLLHEVNKGGSFQGGINHIQGEISGLFTQPHMPNMGHVIEDISTGPTSNVVVPAAMGGILGYVMEEANLHPMLNQIGRLLKSLGTGVAIGATGGSLLSHATLDFSGGGPPGRPYGGHNGYPIGAGYSPLGRRDGGYFTMPNVPPSTPTLPTILPGSPRPN